MKKKKTFTPWFPNGTGALSAASRILGIDPSLTSTGLCLLAGGAIEWHGSINRQDKDAPRGPERLADLHDTFIRMLDTVTVHVQAAVIEGYAYGSSNNREALAEWGGIIRLELFRRGIPLLVVAPPTLRKFVLTESGDGKDKMILASFKRWGVEFDTNDECDAHALARLGAVRIGLESENPFGSWSRGVTARMSEAAQTADPLIFGKAQVAGPVRRRTRRTHQSTVVGK